MKNEKTELTDGSPVTEDHLELKANGQQKGYVVLTTAERAKGYVRPMRDTYKHVGIRPKYSTRDLTEEEKERHKGCDYLKYEEYPESESPMAGRFWTESDLNSGCGTTTTMGITIAQTYACDPKFYGSTFCSYCGIHIPVAEFVWDKTNEIVGE